MGLYKLCAAFGLFAACFCAVLGLFVYGTITWQAFGMLAATSAYMAVMKRLGDL